MGALYVAIEYINITCEWELHKIWPLMEIKKKVQIEIPVSRLKVKTPVTDMPLTLVQIRVGVLGFGLYWGFWSLRFVARFEIATQYFKVQVHNIEVNLLWLKKLEFVTVILYCSKMITKIQNVHWLVQFKIQKKIWESIGHPSCISKLMLSTGTWFLLVLVVRVMLLTWINLIRHWSDPWPDKFDSKCHS